ncbi:MAG: PHP domain-containing protein, partial [Chloroflexota bacterium]
MFTHLHTHSYYSFLDGIPSPNQLVQAAVQHGMPALALTDHHGMTGDIKFYDACREAGVKPILGMELAINHRSGQGNLVLLAMDLEGWASLCRLSSAAQTAPHRDPSRGISFDRLVEETTGLICLSGGKRGLIQRLLEIGQKESALRFLGELQSIFPTRLYVELQLQQPADMYTIRQLAAAAQQLKLPIVATNNVHYISIEQASQQRTLSAMRLNVRLDDLPPNAPAPPGSHFASGEEMAIRFAEYPEAIANTQEITRRCNLELPLGMPHYPEIQLPPGETALGKLRKLAQDGAKQRYAQITPEIQARLNHELDIIGERGYAVFFLIVQEILEYARETGVPTSSRGSAASSLVAHCLGITTPDPLALNLYFERFLNPARSSPPDIDTDLSSVRRDGVIRHVYEQYGQDRVAMVATINRFRRRSALREVAKA